MARRKHHKKHTSRRKKHSMSGVKGMATNALAIIAGGVAGRFVGNFVGSSFASTSSYKGYIQAGVPIALGFLTPKVGLILLRKTHFSQQKLLFILPLLLNLLCLKLSNSLPQNRQNRFGLLPPQSLQIVRLKLQLL